MSLFEWKNDYSVGVLEIDNQHKKLIALINQLFDAMKKGQSNQVLGQIISELILYTHTHFRTEEKYFERFQYQGSEEHKARHQAFVNDVNKFKASFEAGKVALSLSLFTFLKDWLNHHILNEDKKYVDCFRQNGLS